jgi:hypothetical protein
MALTRVRASRGSCCPAGAKHAPLAQDEEPAAPAPEVRGRRGLGQNNMGDDPAYLLLLEEEESLTTQ